MAKKRNGEISVTWYYSSCLSALRAVVPYLCSSMAVSQESICKAIGIIWVMIIQRWLLGCTPAEKNVLELRSTSLWSDAAQIWILSFAHKVIFKQSKLSPMKFGTSRNELITSSERRFIRKFHVSYNIPSFLDSKQLTVVQNLTPGWMLAYYNGNDNECPVA